MNTFGFLDNVVVKEVLPIERIWSLFLWPQPKLQDYEQDPIELHCVIMLVSNYTACKQRQCVWTTSPVSHFGSVEVGIKPAISSLNSTGACL